MTCSEIERRIYLYRELTPVEREDTDEHIRDCQACRLIMENASVSERILASLRNHTPRLKSDVAMTRRIISAIDTTRKKASGIDALVIALFTPGLRYSMAALSLLLIFLFAAENKNCTQRFPLADENQQIIGGKMELNLASFHSAFLKAKETDRTELELAKCLRYLRNDLYKCTDLRNKYAKP